MLPMVFALAAVLLIYTNALPCGCVRPGREGLQEGFLSSGVRKVTSCHQEVYQDTPPCSPSQASDEVGTTSSSNTRCEVWHLEDSQDVFAE